MLKITHYMIWVLLLYFIIILFSYFFNKGSFTLKIYEEFKSLNYIEKFFCLFFYSITSSFWFLYCIAIIYYFFKYLLFIFIELYAWDHEFEEMICYYEKLYFNMKNNKNKNDNNSELYISYPFIKNDNFRLYQYEYVTYIEAFKEIIKNIKNSAIKRGYLRVYYIINKDKKINLNEIELFLFRYIFKIPLNVFYNTIITVKNINIEYKKNIKRTLKIRIICVFKSLLKDILFLTETKDLDYVNLKIIIKNGKIRTNGLYSIIGQSFLFLDPKYRFYIIYAVSKNGKMREHLAYRWRINNDYKKMSLTSVRKVSYVDIYNKWSSIKTNFIGYQENGKEQYILNYEYGNNFDKVYLESLKLDVSLLKEFGIMDQKSHIGFLMKIHIAVLAQEEWNILSRGTYSYQYKTTLNLSRSFIEEHIKLKEMSNDEAYEYLKMSLNTIEMQYLEKIYHENYTRYCYLHKNEIIDDIRKKITYNEQDFE